MNEYKIKLKDQIREAYGRVLYTQTCHHKMSERLSKRNSLWKIIQIVLSAATSSSTISIFIWDEFFSKLITAILSISLTAITLYFKNFNLIEDAKKHQESALRLWKVREEYISLLVDLDYIEIIEIVERRNDLQSRTEQIYKDAPKTDCKSYKEAQKALKVDEEQTFSDNEIDMMLPVQIRKTKTKK